MTRGGPRAAGLVAGLLLLLAAAAAAGTAQTGDPGDQKAPATPALTGSLHTPLEGSNGTVAFQVHLAPEALPDGTEHLLLMVFTESEAVTVREAQLAVNGTPLDLRTETAPQGNATRVFATPANLTDQPQPMALTAQVELASNGRFQVHALAMAFDADWGTLPLSQRPGGELYNATWVGTQAVNTSGLAPPIRGQGNVVPAPGGLPALLLLVGCAAVAGRSARVGCARR